MTTIGKVNLFLIKENVSCHVYEIKWEMPNISSLLNERAFSYKSPSFFFAGKNWYLMMKMTRRLNDGNSVRCIGLYLVRKSSNHPTILDFSLGIKRLDGKKDLEHHRTYEFDKYWLQCGVDSCIAMSELIARKSDLMPNDVLTLFCNLKYISAAEASNERYMPVSSTSFQKKILEDFKQIFLKKENCDVILTVKGQEFPVHKSIIAARSPVLEAMFRNNMRENKTNNVDIEDCDPASFPVFLCFLYCEDAESISQENVFDLYAAADKYDVPDLRSKCADFMKENLSVGIFCETITLALKYTETELINLANDFFVKNAENIVITSKWQTFNAENPIQGNELFIKFIASVKG